MTDNNNNSNNVEVSLLPDIIPGSTKEEVLNPSASLLGQALRGIAHKVLDPLVRYNIVRDEAMKDFEEKIQSKTGAIPLENRDDSKLGLTLKAAEDATYQLDSEELRQMFANLIAATVDNRINDQVLPSFSSVLKDLSPDDAKLLSELPVYMPIISIRLTAPDKISGITVAENTLLFENKVVDNPVSLSSLERLGLISIASGTELKAEHFKQRYEDFKNNETYKYYEKLLPFEVDGLKLTTIKTQPGRLSVTPFGEKFLSCVLTHRIYEKK